MQVYNFKAQEYRQPTANNILRNNLHCARPVFQAKLVNFTPKPPANTFDMLETIGKVYVGGQDSIGIFPHEFMSAIRKNTGGTFSSKKAKECVAGVKETFAQGVQILRQIDDEINKTRESFIDNMNLEQLLGYMKQELSWRVLDDGEKAIPLQQKSKKQFDPAASFTERIEAQAAAILEQGFKKNKLIPADAKVRVTRLDAGRAGTGYKVSVVDKDDRKIFKDKVIKVYKNLDPFNQHKFKFCLRKFILLKGNYDSAKAQIDKMYSAYPEQKFPRIKGLKQQVSEELEYIANTSLEQYSKKVASTVREQQHDFDKNNGLLAEAIIANYVREKAGIDLTSTDLIKYFYTDFKHKYALTEFSSCENLGPVRRSIINKIPGIQFTDINDTKMVNYIDGRLIDYGQFLIDDNILSENSVARNIYNKISRIQTTDSETTTEKRIQKFNQIYLQALRQQFPKSFDMLLGLFKAKELIPEDKRCLLLS